MHKSGTYVKSKPAGADLFAERKTIVATSRLMQEISGILSGCSQGAGEFERLIRRCLEMHADKLAMVTVISSSIWSTVIAAVRRARFLRRAAGAQRRLRDDIRKRNGWKWAEILSDRKETQWESGS